MSHKPKPVRDHYNESFFINLKDLKRRMKEKSVPDKEVDMIVDLISEPYFIKVDEIVKECEMDIMALEKVPTPLKLFVECINAANNNVDYNSSAHPLLERYVMAWEDWM